MRELNTMKEKILDRTMYLIGKRGTMDVTVRAIRSEQHTSELQSDVCSSDL